MYTMVASYQELLELPEEVLIFFLLNSSWANSLSVSLVQQGYELLRHRSSNNNSNNNHNHNRLSLTSDYDCILAMPLRPCKSGRMVTQFSVPTNSVTVSVIQRDALRNTSWLTATGSLNTWTMCEGQSLIFNVPTIWLWYAGPLSLGLDPKDSAILRLQSLLKDFLILARLRLELPTAWLTAQASSNC